MLLLLALLQLPAAVATATSTGLLYALPLVALLASGIAPIALSLPLPLSLCDSNHFSVSYS
jgi:hypothetical protein